MKTIGMIGGMSWESTVTYYQIINEVVKEELGGLHSAKIMLYSVDFEEIEKYQSGGEWDRAGGVLAEAAKKLEYAGADYIIICTNTMHKVVPQIEAGIGIPVIHIAEATADVLLQSGIKRVALLGTKYTMTQDFYKEKLIGAGIEVLIPGDEEIEEINEVIFKELCRGIISEASKQKYLAVIDKLAAAGAQGVILGCTEIGMLIREADSALPVFDTTQIHATKAALLSIR